MQAVGIEPLRGRQQRRHLLGKPRLDRLGLASGRGFRARCQRRDFGEPRRQQTAQSGAFLAAHSDKTGQCLVEAGEDRSLGGAAVFLALVFFGDLDARL